jgi:hypothetical protein
MIMKPGNLFQDPVRETDPPVMRRKCRRDDVQIPEKRMD